MKRTVVNINEDLCDGCTLCIPNCHEGALQMIDGKARLISDLFCDGLGACLGHCPQGAITLEEREAEPYNETKVMEIMMEKGNNTIVAHLDHLLDHGEKKLFEQGVAVLIDNEFMINVPATQSTLREKLLHTGIMENMEENSFCACPGSKTIDLSAKPALPEKVQQENQADLNAATELGNWPIQMHLINPAAGYFSGADLLVAADCTAFSLGAFHAQMLKNKKLVIACPKLDDGKDRYIQKFTSLIDDAKVNTITAAIMEVPCCGGLMQLLQMAREQAQRKVPIKKVVVGIQGDILSEEWI